MYAFVGGTPAAGKTYIVREFIKNSKIDMEWINLDELRKGYSDPALKYWVDFFWKQDEFKYWSKVSYEDHINNLIKQSEAFWPNIKEKIKEILKSKKHAIFESINLLPHLIKEYPHIPTIFFILEDQKLILKRLKKNPRWGQSIVLQRLEAKYFVEYDAKFIKEEAIKYGYMVTDNPKVLIQELQMVFKN